MATSTDATRVKPGEIGVRMYNVGFGDCFVIFIPGEDRTRKILVDCGSMAKANLAINDIADQVIADVSDDDGHAEIDVVIATHRHRDHVSGFASEGWKHVEVSEVWMPWTEDPRSAEARRIREGQTAFAEGMKRHLVASDPAFGDRVLAIADDAREEASDLLERLGATTHAAAPAARSALRAFLTLNALSNPQAMTTLHSGFAGAPKRWFLPQGASAQRARSFETPALPGVKVSVLGPSRDPAVIRSLNPPKSESYFRLASADVGDTPPPPVAKAWALSHDDPQIAHLRLNNDDLRTLHLAAEGDGEALAAANDSKINGTSLVLVLEIFGVHLLLAGDAQWGTWKAVLDDEEWRALVSQTLFFKVGHHGSHNASPKSLIEALGRLGQAFIMVSTRTFGSWDIPRPPLLSELRRQKAKVARSDEAAAAPFIASENWTDLIIPAQ